MELPYNDQHVFKNIGVLDVEYTQAMLKHHQSQASPRDFSFIEVLLPQQDGPNIILPVRSLFESWKGHLVTKGLVDGNWVEVLAAYINGGDIDDRKRMLYGWLSGEHIPSGPHIEGFLKNIQAIDDDIDWIGQYKWFCLAAMVQRLYRSLEECYPDLSKEDIALHFQAFKFHSQEALKSLYL